MIELLWTFQNRILGIQPLLPLAVVTLAVGLCVWLGGPGLRRFMFALIGAYCGALCILFTKNSNLMLLVALVAIGVLLALRLQEFFLVLTASIIAAVYGFSLLIRPYVDTSGELITIMRDLAIGVPYYNWPILLVMIAAPVALSSACWRLTSVVLCSATGTALLSAGAIMVLTYKGVSAVACISARQEIFVELFIIVTVIGTIVQWLVMPKLDSRIAAARGTLRKKLKRTKKGKAEGSERKAATWRTA